MPNPAARQAAAQGWTAQPAAQQAPSMAAPGARALPETALFAVKAVGAAAGKIPAPVASAELAALRAGAAVAAAAARQSGAPAEMAAPAKFAYTPTGDSMARYVIVRTVDSVVVNAVEWDGDIARWRPDVGHSAVLSARAGNIGDTFNGAIFIPPPPGPTPPADALTAELDAILADATVLGRLRQLTQALRRFHRPDE